MNTDRFREEDTAEFLRIAAAEGWISDDWELGFLRSAFPQGCLVKRIQGFPAAFVTAVRYERSGWIGNLLVQPDLRRRGIGAELMAEALDALVQAGVETVWLTASPSGKQLYERLGFREIDTIRRWEGAGLEIGPVSPAELSLNELVRLDADGWGDRRERLLSSLMEVGEVHAGPGGFLVVRPVGIQQQIGPWTGVSAAALVTLLEQSVRPTRSDSGEIYCLDVPTGNAAVTRCLEWYGFESTGSTVLMYQGKLPEYIPDLIGALGSFGSMG